MPEKPRERRVEVRDVFVVPLDDRCDITLRDYTGEETIRITMADAARLQKAIWWATSRRRDKV